MPLRVVAIAGRWTVTILPTSIELSHNPIDPIIVVSAAIVDAESKRLFVQRRSGKTDYPWHWCTPGGKVGPNEGLWSALFRELAEEHGVRVEHGLFGRDLWPHADPVYTHEITSSRTGQPMRVLCRFIPSAAIIGRYSANAEAVAGFDWVTANELETLILTPADDANRGALLGLIR